MVPEKDIQEHRRLSAHHVAVSYWYLLRGLSLGHVTSLPDDLDASRNRLSAAFCDPYPVGRASVNIVPAPI